VVASTQVPTPRDLRAGFGSLWLANGPARTVTRIDPASGAVIAVIPVAAPASVLATGEGSVWVTSFPGNTVTRIDPVTNAVTGSISLASVGGRGPIGVTVYEGFVWVADHDGTPTTSIAKIDPASMNVVDVVPVGPLTIAGPTKVIGADGSIWTDVPSIPGAVRIDPATDTIVATIPNKGSCADMIGDDAAVWVADDGGSGCQSGYPGLSRIDTATNSVGLFNAGGSTDAVALDGSTLWYGTTKSDFLGRLDTATDTVVGQLKLPGPIFAVAVAGGHVWVTDAADGLLFDVLPT
jgi:streptogramin lyase